MKRYRPLRRSSIVDTVAPSPSKHHRHCNRQISGPHHERSTLTLQHRRVERQPPSNATSTVASDANHRRTLPVAANVTDIVVVHRHSTYLLQRERTKKGPLGNNDSSKDKTQQQRATHSQQQQQPAHKYGFKFNLVSHLERQDTRKNLNGKRA